ncbi:MAG TPA: sulfite reductase flavoprotein subunit alpha [Hyphomicrobium sp.]|nr:sulfite reductase flavoprotein subunit alpha [Hyphomicrobium sp.]
MRGALFVLATMGAGVASAAAAGATADTLTTDLKRLIATATMVVAYLIFCAVIAIRHAVRHKMPTAAPENDRGAPAVLVAYASQTGTAEELARSTFRALEAAHVPSRIVSFAHLDAATLTRAQIALLIVSTTGEGDPPDSAARFVRTVMGSRLTAPGLRYGVLALGDRAYTQFCAFGDAVHTSLSAWGAAPMFDAIRVDNEDPASLDLWWQQLQALAGAPLRTDPSATVVTGTWTLADRALANPDDAEHPAYYVALQPSGELPEWSAGDIAVIRPQNDPAEVRSLLARLELDGEMQLDGPAGRQSLARHLAGSVLPKTPDEIAALARRSPALLAQGLQPLPTREYSIASLPDDGRIELLVRQMRLADGRLGIGSGWLTSHAALCGRIELSVRANTAFHPPAPQRPLILIGNGTGIAGLRAHLKARVKANVGRNWLIFGERSARTSFFYRDEIEAWHRRGLLERADFAFSRDQTERTYVQDCVRSRAAGIRAWIEAGAAIYVCGSLRGMSTAVTSALSDIVGDDKVAEMIETGLYRRDVY